MTPEITISVEISPGNGYAAIYATVRKGEVAETIEVREGVNVDVDKEGLLLGVELIQIIDPCQHVQAVAHFNLPEIQQAIEARFVNEPKNRLAIRELSKEIGKIPALIDG